MTSSGQSYSYPRRDPGPPGTDFELFEVRALSKGNMREAGSGGTQCQRMVAMEMGLSKKKAVGGYQTTLGTLLSGSSHLESRKPLLCFRSHPHNAASQCVRALLSHDSALILPCLQCVHCFASRSVLYFSLYTSASVEDLEPPGGWSLQIPEPLLSY